MGRVVGIVSGLVLLCLLGVAGARGLGLRGDDGERCLYVVEQGIGRREMPPLLIDVASGRGIVTHRPEPIRHYLDTYLPNPYSTHVIRLWEGQTNRLRGISLAAIGGTPAQRWETVVAFPENMIPQYQQWSPNGRYFLVQYVTPRTSRISLGVVNVTDGSWATYEIGAYSEIGNTLVGWSGSGDYILSTIERASSPGRRWVVLWSIAPLKMAQFVGIPSYGEGDIQAIQSAITGDTFAVTYTYRTRRAEVFVIGAAGIAVVPPKERFFQPREALLSTEGETLGYTYNNLTKDAAWVIYAIKGSRLNPLAEGVLKGATPIDAMRLPRLSLVWLKEAFVKAVKALLAEGFSLPMIVRSSAYPFTVAYEDSAGYYHIHIYEPNGGATYQYTMPPNNGSYLNKVSVMIRQAGDSQRALWYYVPGANGHLFLPELWYFDAPESKGISLDENRLVADFAWSREGNWFAVLDRFFHVVEETYQLRFFSGDGVFRGQIDHDFYSPFWGWTSCDPRSHQP